MYFLEREEGQGLAEYAWLLGLVALVLIVLVTVMGQQLIAFYQYIINTLPFL